MSSLSRIGRRLLFYSVTAAVSQTDSITAIASASASAAAAVAAAAATAASSSASADCPTPLLLFTPAADAFAYSAATLADFAVFAVLTAFSVLTAFTAFTAFAFYTVLPALPAIPAIPALPARNFPYLLYRHNRLYHLTRRRYLANYCFYLGCFLISRPCVYATLLML